MNRVLAGVDPVLIDTYVAQILGLQLEEVPYIELAAELGVGSTDLSPEQVVSINKVEKIAGQDLTTGRKVESLRNYINERQACSSCVGSLLHALQRCQDKQQLPTDKEVYIGQGWQGREKEELGIGNCTQQFADFVPGCPPTAAQIREKLITNWNLD